MALPPDEFASTPQERMQRSLARQSALNLPSSTPIARLSEAGKGARAFIDETQALGGGAVALGAQGLQAITPDAIEPQAFEDARQWGLDVYGRNMAESRAPELLPTVAKIEDIKFGEEGGASRLADWAAFHGTKGLGTVATLALGGGAGGAVAKQAVKSGVRRAARGAFTKKLKKEVALGLRKPGAVLDKTLKKVGQVEKGAQKQVAKAVSRGRTGGLLGGAFALEGGESFGKLEGEVGGEKALLPSLTKAAINTALEIAPWGVAAKYLKLGQIAPAGLAKAIKADKGLSKMAQQIAKGAAAGVAAEGLTEGLQELVGLAGERWAKEEPMFASLSPEDLSQIANAAAAGALVGGGVGGVVGPLKGKAEQDQVRFAEAELAKQEELLNQAKAQEAKLQADFAALQNTPEKTAAVEEAIRLQGEKLQAAITQREVAEAEWKKAETEVLRVTKSGDVLAKTPAAERARAQTLAGEQAREEQFAKTQLRAAGERIGVEEFDEIRDVGTVAPPAEVPAPEFIQSENVTLVDPERIRQQTERAVARGVRQAERQEAAVTDAAEVTTQAAQQAWERAKGEAGVRTRMLGSRNAQLTRLTWNELPLSQQGRVIERFNTNPELRRALAEAEPRAVLESQQEQQATPASPQQVREAIAQEPGVGQKWVKKAESTGFVRIVEGVNEKDPRRKASWDGNRVTIYSGAVGAETLGVPELLHEGTHAKLDLMLDRSLDKFAREIEGLQAKNPLAEKAVAKANAVAKARYPNDEALARIHYDEELVAYYVEFAREGGAGGGVYRRLVNRIKAWFAQTDFGQALKRAGLGVKLTDDMAVALARRAVTQELGVSETQTQATVEDTELTALFSETATDFTQGLPSLVEKSGGNLAQVAARLETATMHPATEQLAHERGALHFMTQAAAQRAGDMPLSALVDGFYDPKTQTFLSREDAREVLRAVYGKGDERDALRAESQEVRRKQAQAGAVVPEGIEVEEVDLSALPREVVAKFEQLAGDEQGVLESTVWHAGPNQWLPEPGFPYGRPRLDKVGTGEGGQLFGWGFYTAENEAVSGPEGSYTKAFTRVGNKEQLLDDFILQAPSAYQDMLNEAKGFMDLPLDRADLGEAVGNTLEGYSIFSKDLSEKIRALSLMQKAFVAHLEVPDADIARMIQWEKPLSEQTEEVKEVLARLKEKGNKYKFYKEMQDWLKDQPSSMSGVGLLRAELLKLRNDDRGTFNDFLRSLSKTFTRKKGAIDTELVNAFYRKALRNPYSIELDEKATGQNLYDRLDSILPNVPGEHPKKKVSEYLQSIGIVGNKYLDWGSRPGQTKEFQLQDSQGSAYEPQTDIEKEALADLAELAGDFDTAIDLVEAKSIVSESSRGDQLKEVLTKWQEQQYKLVSLSEPTYNYVVWDQDVLDRVAHLNPETGEALSEQAVLESQQLFTNIDPGSGPTKSWGFGQREEILDESQSTQHTLDKVFNPAVEFFEPSYNDSMDRSQFNRFREWAQDRFVELKQKQTLIERQTGKKLPEPQLAYETEEGSHGRKSDRKAQLEREFVDPMFQAMHRGGFNLDQANLAVYANHAQEANAEGRRRQAMLFWKTFLTDGGLDNETKKEMENEKARVWRETKTAKGVNKFQRKQRMTDLVDRYAPKVREEVQADWAAFRAQPSGMTDAEAQTILKGHEGNKEMVTFLQLFDDMNASVRQWYVDVGMLTRKQAAEWSAYKHYAALQREKYKDEPGLGTGRGYSPGKASAIRTYAAHRAYEPFTNSIWKAEKAIDKAENNKVMTSLAKLIRAHPDEKFWEVRNFDTVPYLDINGFVSYGKTKAKSGRDAVFWENGEPKIIHATEGNQKAEAIIAGMNHLNAPKLGPVLSVMRKANRFMAMMNTSLSPEFFFTNLPRDFFTAQVNMADSEAGSLRKKINSYYLPSAKALRNVFRAKTLGTEFDTGNEWVQWARKFEESGGRTGWMDMYEDTEQRRKKLETRLRQLKPGKGLHKGLHHVATWIEDYNAVAENAMRLATFRSLVEAKVPLTRAVSIVKDITVNFNRRGSAGNAINALYMFAGAGIQGSARILMAAKNSPKVRKILGGIVITSFVVDQMNRALSDDDEYDKVPGYEKERNMVFVNPAGGPIIKIPAPWGYNTVWAIGQKLSEAFSHYQGEALPDWTLGGAGADLASTAFGAFMPIGGGTLLQTLSPTVFDPLVQIGENKNAFGKQLKPEPFPGEIKPLSEQYWKSASGFSQWAAKTVHEQIGQGDDVTESWAGFAPGWLDAIISQIFGGVGRTLKDVGYELPVSALSGDEIELRQVPVIRKLFTAPSDRDEAMRYHDRVSQALTAQRRLKAYTEGPARDLKKARELRKDSRSLLQMGALVKDTERQIRSLRQRMKLAGGRGDETGRERFGKKIKEAQKRFNETWRRRVS